jgi:hypothetical protein
MPITYEVDRASRLMVTRIGGRITPAEAFAYLDQIIADPDNDQCDELMILDDVDLSGIGAADIRALARRASELTQDDQFRVAVVAPRDADFGVWRMFQTFRDLGDHRMAVFRRIEEACDWLGVKAP